jgi:hypothetical protein
MVSLIFGRVFDSTHHTRVTKPFTEILVRMVPESPVRIFMLQFPLHPGDFSPQLGGFGTSLALAVRRLLRNEEPAFRFHFSQAHQPPTVGI